MRRVDNAARRMFQERWLRRRGKVLVISPAEAGLRSQSLSVAWEASLEVLYLGSFGLGLVATLPVAAVAMVLKPLLPEPAIRGATDGARDAVASVDRLLVANADPDSILEPASPTTADAAVAFVAGHPGTVDLPGRTSATAAFDPVAPEPTTIAAGEFRPDGATGTLDHTDPDATTAPGAVTLAPRASHPIW